MHVEALLNTHSIYNLVSVNFILVIAIPYLINNGILGEPDF